MKGVIRYDEMDLSRVCNAPVFLQCLMWISMWLVPGFLLQAQKEDRFIMIQNNSFEGIPGCCKVPDGWVNDGDLNFTPPDLLPALNEYQGINFPHEYVFNVQKMPMHGHTYLAMAVRQQGSYERVKQRLNSPLKADHCYGFSIYLSYSDTWVSPTFENPNHQSFGKGGILRVWGHTGKLKELLATSPSIDHLDWYAYQVNFRPKNPIEWIALEAYYAGNEPYNGNILLDGMSNVYMMSCTEEVRKPD